MGAGLLGYWLGVLTMTALIPALISGLFRRKRPPSRGWIAAAWTISVILGASGAASSGMWAPPAVGWAILAALTALRLRA